MKIQQSKIDEISSAVDIVDLISHYTNLRRAGKNFMGRCPFHEERTPSFSVSQEKGVYHCFGCGKGGNIFTFVMEKEIVTFSESVRILAAKANIKLEFEEEDSGERNQIQTLFEIHKFTAKYFYDNLTGPLGKYPRQYLSGRQITEHEIKKFGLGFSLKEHDSLYKLLVSKFEVEDILASGLAIRRDKGDVVDRFKGRLMFPIFNESGKVVAFGGRKIYEDGEDAKYINSPETRIYYKSRILYGLNFAKEEIRKTGYVILVEGYMDLISLFRNNICSVTASSGTSLTELQVRILSRYTKEIVLIFDSDTAGKKAASRGIELILENDLNVSIIALPPGYDPDSFIKEQGKDKFLNLLNQRKSVINYIAERFEEQGQLRTPEGKTQFIRAIISLIAKMKDPIKKELYIKETAERFGIFERLLRSELDKHLGLKRQGMTREAPSKETPGTIERKATVQIPQIEKQLIKLLLDSDDNVRQYILNNIETDLFSSPDSVKVINYVGQYLAKHKNLNPASLVNEFGDSPLTEIISSVLVDENILPVIVKRSGYMNHAKKLIYFLKKGHLEKKIQEIKTAIKVKDTNSTEFRDSQRHLVELEKEKIQLTELLQTAG